MRRRGLEPPPGYPGPGPQPGNPGATYVHIAPERPIRPAIWTPWKHRTGWMLSRVLSRIRLAHARDTRDRTLSRHCDSELTVGDDARNSSRAAVSGAAGGVSLLL